MSLAVALQSLSSGQDLTPEVMESAMTAIMQGEADEAQIGGLLMALSVKGETVDEITAAARVMRRFASSVRVDQQHLIDTCGTGGDAKGSFNVSTACAFVAAASGARVAKHGNRSVSSKSGSADVLEAAGVSLDLNPEQVARCIDELNIGFLFAPAHHQATRHAVGPRRSLGVRTLFNLLGPLTNPAGAERQVMGVFHQRWVEPIARVLRNLGARHVMVVHSRDGMDEISIAAPTWVSELRDGTVESYTITPQQFGIERQPDADLAVADAEESLQVIRQALTGEQGPAADIVALNAGAAIYVAGLTETHADGVQLAREVLVAGDAWTLLERLAQYSRSL